MKTALILGISGQDGAYLARLLLRKGYRVVGVSRDPAPRRLWRLHRLGIGDDVEVVRSDYARSGQARALLDRIAPREIYCLAGQSSVSRSFHSPLATLNSIVGAATVWLEAVRTAGGRARLYNAASGEMFGGSESPATLDSPLEPRSPYGAAKATAFLLVQTWRRAWNLYACSGVLFNHESPLRAETFVTRKVVTSAVRIARKRQQELVVGDISVRRDWGWAPEYMEAVWLTLQLPAPHDVVVATGEAHSLEEFIKAVFERLGLDYRRYVRIDAGFKRASEIPESTGDPSQAERLLGWRPSVSFDELVDRLLEDALGDSSAPACATCDMNEGHGAESRRSREG